MATLVAKCNRTSFLCVTVCVCVRLHACTHTAGCCMCDRDLFSEATTCEIVHRQMPTFRKGSSLSNVESSWKKKI